MTTNTFITIVAVVGLLIWVVLQQVTTQRYTLRRMWLIPLILVVLTYTNLKPEVLNNQWEVLALVVAFGVGGIYGLGRSRLNQIELDRATAQLVVKGSVVGLMVWIGFVLLEIAFRLLLSNLTASDSPLTTVLPLAAATGLFCGWRAMWFVKYLQLKSYSEYRQ